MTVTCAVITVSDTRSPETDRSGQLIKQLLIDAGHAVTEYTILKDEPAQIQAQLEVLGNSSVDAVIFNGGTGIAPRDTTYDAIESLLEKSCPDLGSCFAFSVIKKLVHERSHLVRSLVFIKVS
jgi:molybdenum cofactor biosynthesis protein B